MSDNALPQLMTIHELSELLGVPVATIRKWREQGRGPATYRVGGSLRFSVSDVAAWLAANRDEGGQR